MVVTRKTPVAPVPMGSRTNSSQPPPRVAKPKSALAEVDPPAAKNATTSSEKPHAKSKHKNRHHRKATKPSRSFLDTLVYLSLFLLGLYAFTTCPADIKLANPVCRSLSQYRVHVLEPYVLPPLYHALSHPAVAPYVAQAEAARAKTAPYAAAAVRAASHAADTYVLPIYRRYVLPQWHAHVVPQWRKHVLPPWHKHVDPRIAQFTPYAVQAQRTLERTAYTLHKTYTKQVKPFVLRAYALARPHVVNAYRVVQPRVVALYVWVAAEAGKARRAYVDPHVIRIWAKVLELSGAEPTTATATTETAATTVKPTSTHVIKSKGRAEATVTPVEAPSSSASASATPEEAVPEPSSSSSPTSVAPVETASSVAPPPPAEIPPAETSAEIEVDAATSAPASPAAPAAAREAAASIAAQSAHGMESAVVEEILAESSSAPVAETASSVQTSSSSPVETPAETPSSVETPAAAETKTAASVAAQSAHGMESAVVQQILDVVEEEPVLGVEEHDETDDFLANLGLEDPEMVNDSDDLEYDEDGFIKQDIVREPELSEEELAALKLKQTAEKRADLEGRMSKSNVRLTALVVEKRKQLRKALVAARKAGVSKLAGIKEKEMGELEAEAEKLLKGLEGYVKKEEKAALSGKAGSDDKLERAEKWERVVGRVEEKLGERVTAVQTAFQGLHVQEKEGEVNEGMAIIQQVKDACGQAQGDVGLDLSWLDDVTYLDWQVYHDLARIGETFQAEASEIQAGTHSNPPVDPFIPALQAAQAELGTLVEGIVERIAGLRRRAGAAFAGVAPVAEKEEPVEASEEPVAFVEETVDVPVDAPEAEKGEEEAPEPEVSILPIVPEAPKMGTGAGAAENVILGKSAEQVAQALRDVPLEKAPPHEEL